MKIRVLAILAVYCMLSAAAQTQESAKPNPQPKPSVVVELFTSEGCSDCPPADELLNAIAQAQQSASRGINIIPLAFHVTYWDEQGWHDRFDDNRYTDRQRDYQTQFHTQSIYTPQSVIDGRYETVGNNRPKVVSLIQHAAADPKPVDVEVTVNGDSVTVNAKTSNAKTSGKVLLAITQDDLSTEVKAGENKAKTLHHDAVVRSLENLGKLKDGSFSRTVSLKLKNDWERNKLHAIVLVQDNEDHILGASTTAFAAASTAALNR